MLTYTNYLPAVRHVNAPERISTADPWPTLETVLHKARVAFVYSCRPARYGSLASDWAHYARPGLYCRLSDGTMATRTPIRVSTEHLPVISIQDWLVYTNAPRDVATPLEPARKPRRRIGWLERQVDKILAWQEARRAAKQEGWLR